jgi:glutamine synthetase adenylyltransferase
MKDLFEKIAESADPEAGMSVLKIFENACFESHGKYFDWNSDAAQRLLSIFGNSRVLAGKLAAHPEWAYEFTADPLWDKPKNTGQIKSELDAATSGIELKDTASWQRALRNFKYRQMIRIVSKDLDGAAGVQDILTEWSGVADALIEKAYDVCVQNTAAHFGMPVWLSDSGTYENCAGILMALGKLGGRELNMSSDVDLLCLYESDDGKTEGGPSGRITNHEFFTKVIFQLNSLLSTVTRDGFVFRCDYDLRPEGPKGPLVNSVLAAERYYETFGRDWERQMLIRARPVAGDIALGEAFIEYISPFVYRRSLSFSDLSHLREMKQKIETQSLRFKNFEDIKLGQGGIRELEFIVQGFQQVFGGHIRDIRLPNTFETIRALARHDLIHPHGAKILSEAYEFMRRLENMLQINEDLQTHDLPVSENELASLGRKMGWRGESDGNIAKRLLSAWRNHAGAVHRLFNGLFNEDYDRLELEDAINANLATCESEEEKADSLSWFKKEEVKRLARLDIDKKIGLQPLLKKLSLAAEVVIDTALNLAGKTLQERFGKPQHEDGLRSSFAIVGMGRLGSREMDYGSDLDLCFIYSGEGRTSGPAIITNQEYFTRLSQRIISLISLNTRYGRAYSIDSELRPSGNQGSLVTTLDSFTNYHLNNARVWERLALLKARAVSGDRAFLKTVNSCLASIRFESPVPDEFELKSEIVKLRKRFEEEAANERDGVYNLKIGFGGLADLESIYQFLQILNAKEHPGLRIQNGFEIIERLGRLQIIDGKTHETMSNAYHFKRLLISNLRLFTSSAADILDFSAPYIEPLAKRIGQDTPQELKNKIILSRNETRELWRKFFE